MLKPHLSHVGWFEDRNDDQNVANDAADNHQGVENNQDVKKWVRDSLVVHNVL